ncbi:MAG: DUF5013 domain-containing protein [Bacteroidaceae bacterium]|nr:DUF5013 domain-containing protein [Bacteroidaceae bacterium]
MKPRTLVSVFAMAFCVLTQAQDIRWDKDKYPDYDPTPHVNQKQIEKMMRRVKARRAEGVVRPDHWNNAASTAFPPVMNQSAGSCGSASRIYYMFSHELNAARHANGKLAENIYPTHFTWLLTWTPNQGKEIIAQHNGVPNSEVYGGYTYSEVFGYQDCDDGQSNYGWMQGYDKWYHAMHNRISGSANFSNPLNTEEGREILKNYLWNHCGDESYSTGGIVGVGVASSGNWQKIPKTTTNDQLGVTGMYYVKHWGESVDHALTIVGYDDRIEFDLDGNDIYGEANKDEIGAWIIVNSWGSGWCNGGFIYCPYAEARPTATTTGFWTPEYYTPRRDYRPLRTLKVTMDYDHRSELALYVGVSSKTNASTPEKETWLRHFYYSGLGKGVTVDANNPDPAVPMLGKWADGTLHSEPMEFGYDITDLTQGFDTTKPLKYFFRVEPRSWAAGSGTIYKASIIDYTLDREGVETPFDLGEEGTAIANKGKKTTITTIAQGESVPTPRNLTIDANGMLAWKAPVGTTYDVHTYNIYKDNELLTSVDGHTLNADASSNGTYTVSAIYRINGYDVQSEPSNAVNTDYQTANTYLQLEKGAEITIPEFNKDNANQFTIEFWLRPHALSNSSDNFGMRSTSGKFFFKVNKSKRLEVGFDGGDYATSTRTIKTDTWQHIAITANSGNLNVFVGGVQFISFSTKWSNTVGSVGSLVLGKTEGTTTNYKEIYSAPWTGDIDELRIWKKARTSALIKSTMYETYLYPALTNDLSYCYNMKTRALGDMALLIDGCHGNDATITQPSLTSIHQEAMESEEEVIPFNPKASADFTIPSSITKGVPVPLVSNCAPGTSQWSWTISGADISQTSTPSPIIIFTKEGEQTISLTAINYKGVAETATKTLIVEAAAMPQPDFTIPTGILKAGDHITFLNTTPNLESSTYQWTLQGAENEDVRTINAGATYTAYGTYKVRLTATNPAGSQSVEKDITISKVAPSAAFNIHNNVAIVGEEIILEDASKYDPSEWMWSISNDLHTYIINGQSSTLTIDKPGLYNVSLKASNEIGHSTANRSRAITVCNADGQTGLKFDAEDDEVVSTSPFSSSTSKFTIEWWMYPGALTEACCGMGDSKSTFWMQVDADGAMTFFKNDKSVKTEAGFVIDNEWHHYAITCNSSTFTYYRDGIKINTATLNGSIAAWSQFRLGSNVAPMNAIVDELRIWKSALTQSNLRKNIQYPLEDPVSMTDLALYYDFNQSSGDVIDKSSNNLAGIRYNFGPDGDAWTSSKGIFFLNFATSSTQDVTSKYLKNYKANFIAASGKYVNGTSRFKKLAMGTTTSPWVQENSVVTGGVTTEWHVDTNKGNYLTLTTLWDDFAENVKNLKLYQTVTLPEGVYELTVTRGAWEWNNPSGVNLVAAEGTGLPDYANLGAEALGYSNCAGACTFVIKEESTVSLGLVTNQSGKTCHTIQAFSLKKKEFTLMDADNPVGIRELENEVAATTTLQATGGLGCIKVTTYEPQRIDVFDLSGRLLRSEFIEGTATLRARRGIYVVGGQKVMVR